MYSYCIVEVFKFWLHAGQCCQRVFDRRVLYIFIWVLIDIISPAHRIMLVNITCISFRHHKIDGVEGTAALKMATHLPYRCPHWLHWLPMPGASHWEIKDNILERTISLPSFSLFPQKSRSDDSHPLPTVIPSFTSTPSISTGAMRAKGYGSTHSKFSSLRYNTSCLTLSHSLDLHISLDNRRSDDGSKLERAARAKRYGSTHSKFRTVNKRRRRKKDKVTRRRGGGWKI
jgi:hypothetical protein